jgi:hypothetical protein
MNWFIPKEWLRHKLYDLTEEEIKIIEGTSNGK